MPHSIDKQRDALAGVQRAALAWWESRRPAEWDLRQHLDTPAVNTHSPSDHRLAERVAAAVECGAI